MYTLYIFNRVYRSMYTGPANIFNLAIDDSSWLQSTLLILMDFGIRRMSSLASLAASASGFASLQSSILSNCYVPAFPVLPSCNGLRTVYLAALFPDGTISNKLCAFVYPSLREIWELNTHIVALPQCAAF